jgi:hypothetical protein
VEVIFDQSLLRSAASTIYSAGILQDIITPQQFPKLNTSNFCFFSASLCQLYPNDGIMLDLAAAAAPVTDVNSSGVSVFVNVSVNFSAISSSGAFNPQTLNRKRLVISTSPSPHDAYPGVLSPFLNLSLSLSLAAALALGNNASGTTTSPPFLFQSNAAPCNSGSRGHHRDS